MADAENNDESKTPTPLRKRNGARSGGRKRKTNVKAVRKRTMRPYPASSFEEALPLAEAIQTFASGEKVRRLTLLDHMNKSPTSGPTRGLITNAGRYGLTSGSYAAEWLGLPPHR